MRARPSGRPSSRRLPASYRDCSPHPDLTKSATPPPRNCFTGILPERELRSGHCAPSGDAVITADEPRLNCVSQGVKKRMSRASFRQRLSRLLTSHPLNKEKGALLGL